MRALDAATGKTTWETKYNATFKANPAATSKHGTGPKSTPTFADGRIYSLGMNGVATAFDAATGKQLWQTLPPKTQTLYHTCMSPIVDRGLVIVHVGGQNDGALTAFDEKSGEVKWAWTGDGPAAARRSSSSSAAHAGDHDDAENLVGVDVANGQLLWKRPYSVRATRNAVTPIVHNQIVIVSGLGMPVTGFRVFNKSGHGPPRTRGSTTT
jgi:outer membrane protein assembly factor BamB